TLERDVASRPELRQPFRRERKAGMGFDARSLVLDGLAHEDAHGLVQGQLPAKLAKHFGQHRAGDGLGVDEHAVAVEQDSIERKRGHRYGTASVCTGRPSIPHGRRALPPRGRRTRGHLYNGCRMHATNKEHETSWIRISGWSAGAWAARTFISRASRRRWCATGRHWSSSAAAWCW